MISERNSYWGVNRSNLGQSVRMRRLLRRDEGEAKEKAEAEVRAERERERERAEREICSKQAANRRTGG